MEDPPVTLLDAAVGYARREVAVFPCVPRRKEPLTSHGHLDATTDRAAIARWWRRWPQAGVGIACKPSGIVVTDVDPRNGGDDSLADLERLHGPLPTSWRVLTGGGGLHVILQAPADVALVDGPLVPGIDLKANGYIIAPPSLHPSGRRYAWELGCGPDDIPLASAPAWLFELLTRGRSGDRIRTDATPLVLREGERNIGLFRLACLLRQRGLNSRAISGCLDAINIEHAHPPLGAAELEKIAASAARYAPGAAA